MIKLENFEVMGWEHAIRGMRNPMNSWEKIDSKLIFRTLEKDPDVPGVEGLYWEDHTPYPEIGPNDHNLMMKLAKGGSVHAKYRRMITVYVDITAPLYWWKEFDTYKVGTVANSCSTMHKIHEKEFTLDDFSSEHLVPANDKGETDIDLIVGVVGAAPATSRGLLCQVIWYLNYWRNRFLETKDKKYWWQMIQLLPSSYNQKRTVMLNYEVLTNIYRWRKDHKLDEWREFCKWVEQLPYSEIITGGGEESNV